MSMFITTLAGRAGSLWQHGIAAVRFHVRRPVACRPAFARNKPCAGGTARTIPRGPVIDPATLQQLEQAARTVGKLEWSRRYQEIMQSQEAEPQETDGTLTNPRRRRTAGEIGSRT